MSTNHLESADYLIDDFPDITNHKDAYIKRSYSYCSNLQQFSINSGSTCDSLTLDRQDSNADPATRTFTAHDDDQQASTSPDSTSKQMGDFSICEPCPAREDMVFDWLSSFAGADDDLIISHEASSLRLGSFLSLDDIAATNHCGGFSIGAGCNEFDNANLMYMNDCSTNPNISRKQEINVAEGGQYTGPCAANAALDSDVQATVSFGNCDGEIVGVSMKPFVSDAKAYALTLQTDNDIISSSSTNHAPGKARSKRARSGGWSSTTTVLNCSYPVSDSSSLDSCVVDLAPHPALHNLSNINTNYESNEPNADVPGDLEAFSPDTHLHRRPVASITSSDVNDSKDGNDISTTTNSSPVSLTSSKVSPDPRELSPRCARNGVSSVDVICTRKLEFRHNDKKFDMINEDVSNISITSGTVNFSLGGCTGNVLLGKGADISGNNNVINVNAVNQSGGSGGNAVHQEQQQQQQPRRCSHGGSGGNAVHQEQQQQQPRRCSHCLSQKTPQWRAGPMGPKTLCNACGVRFKSGRLFEEYRPAKSPTFVSYKHSNSHKKVLEMRRRKGCASLQQLEQCPSAATSTIAGSIEVVYDTSNNSTTASSSGRSGNVIKHHSHQQLMQLSDPANIFDDQVVVANSCCTSNKNSSGGGGSSSRVLRYGTSGFDVNDTLHDQQQLQLLHLPHFSGYNGASLLHHSDTSTSTFIC